MAGKKPQPSADLDGLPTTDHMDRLCAAVEKIADEMEKIRTSLDLLWDRVDRLVDDVGWGVINDKFRCGHPPQYEALTSLPVNALAEDCGARIDRHSPEERAEPVPALAETVTGKPRMRDLFS